MTTGLFVDGAGFEVLAEDERIGPRRLIGPDDVTLLAGLASRYARAVRAGSDSAAFVALGRELLAWLDGDERQFAVLLDRAPRPFAFEVQGPRSPSEQAWAVLHAPFELLPHPAGGFLAEDALTRFCVVRRLGPPTANRAVPDDFRLGVAFMASAPRGQHDLDYEAEEAAILTAVGETRLDLLVDDTGDPQQLAQRLAAAGGMPVVHLSCHGVSNWRDTPGGVPVAVLMMETDDGGPRPATAPQLAELLTIKPRLLFVSACLTATAATAAADVGAGTNGGTNGGASGGLVAHSLATALIAAGLPAVLGWDGSVGDRAATLFAERLYGALANQADLAAAVGDARRALLSTDDPRVRADWHLARLWLGPMGGGPLVAGVRKRSLVTATHGTKRFIDGKRKVPVARPEMFVGRRPELQRALRALRSGEHAGVLLHGQGRLGKSSLAARLADRLPGYAVAVVFGDYTALGILDAILEEVRTSPAARDLICSRLPEVRQRPEAISPLLIDLLSGPCRGTGDGDQRPLLLIIDDLEQILAPDPNGPHRVCPAAGPDQALVLSAVLRAFRPSETDSRLILTSRYTFTLNDTQRHLAGVQLRPLSPVAQRKLQRRQQALTGQALLTGRSSLAERAVAVSRGNPGLQDLIVLRLVYSDEVSLSRAEAAVSGMESYLTQGDLPADPEVRTFLEDIALDALLSEAGEPARALLRATTLFDLPVPESVINALAAEVGGSVTRLRGLGLLDLYEDLHAPLSQALRANPLAAGRPVPLSKRERAAVAAVATGPLFTAWGGEAGSSGRDLTLDLQLTRLALLAEDPAIVAACAASGVTALGDGPAADAFRLGQAAIDLLDGHDRAVPLALLRATAEAALTSGDGVAGDALLTRAVLQAQALTRAGDSSVDQAGVMTEFARRLIIRGELDQAELLLRNASELFTATGSERDSALAMGSIADIAYRRGNYEEALQIRRDAELPVYERLGDAGEMAVVWDKISDIADVLGEEAEALRIRRAVVLPVFERLGDTRSAAVVLSKIADSASRLGDLDEALRIWHEAVLPVLEQLGDVREAALTWGKIADAEESRGNPGEALRIRRDVVLPVFERLGDAREAASTRVRIAEIVFLRGDYGQAAELFTTALTVSRQLGDPSGIAAATLGLANIDIAREDHVSAVPRLMESFKINSDLGRRGGLASAGIPLGGLLMAGGQIELAAEVLGVSLAAATQLGWTDVAQRISELLNSLPSETEET